MQTLCEAIVCRKISTYKIQSQNFRNRWNALDVFQTKVAHLEIRHEVNHDDPQKKDNAIELIHVVKVFFSS